MNRTQQAADAIGKAILQLKQAKRDLLVARSDQHIPVALNLAGLEEIYGTLTDPECTPEIMEGKVTP
jgi:hypothetical protein